MSQSQIDGARILDQTRDWLGRFVGVTGEDDLEILTLWAVHTHLVRVTGTTPRLLVTSPVPGSGKTTVLEHLGKLCLDPVQMASVSSPALITRMLAERIRTVLIDEADRALDPKNEGTGEILGVLNSGYKVGATRPVLVPSKEHGWVSQELPTYSPVAMAGNGPNLPEDTLSRCIPIGLLPNDEVEESDWEEIEAEARDLGLAIKEWAEQFLESAPPKVILPEQVKARAKERWRPLKRVAVLAGGRWPEVADRLAADDVQRVQDEREDGLTADRPHIALMQHIAGIWTDGTGFMPTKEIVDRLVWEYPEMWGQASSFGKPLTERRFGVMLNRNYRLTSSRPDTQGPRGHSYATLARVWRRLGIKAPRPPAGSPPSVSLRSDNPAEPAEPDKEDEPVIQMSQIIQKEPQSQNSRFIRPHQKGVEPSGTTDLDTARDLLTQHPGMDISKLNRLTGWGDVQRAGRALDQVRKESQNR